ncbi:glycosyltransferase family 4 protein [Hahella ganghwensis]|uniref:glycosyltransferase family 4 protein n=1 Tax=Hahella ganghwensis TaxID=286420 RepID=UPI00036996E7|nr:glycosyltransferase [Hahella ganghwensis]
MRLLVTIGAYPPDHSGAGKRIRETYSTIERSDKAKGGTFTWKVLSHHVRLSTDINDDTNVSRIKEGKKLPTILACMRHIRYHQIDIVHCVGISKITMCSAWAAIFLRRPYIFELSIDPPEDTLTRFKNKVFNYPLRKASGYIALTSRLKAFFQQISNSQPIFLRPNPVTLNTDGVKGADLIPTLPHLLLGRFSKRKGQEVAIRTLSHLPDTERLILAGPVIGQQDRDYVASLRELVAQLGLENRVEFRTEFVRDVASQIGQCQSVWCFSEREGLPNVVLEALWCGRPAFVNAGLGLQDIVTDYENGLNLPGSPKEKALLIRSALSKDFDNELIRAKAQKLFDLQVHAEKTHQFIKSILPGT